jgi:hypothetical protein
MPFPPIKPVGTSRLDTGTHRATKDYSVISADRMIDGRMMETGFKPATLTNCGPDFVPSRMPIEMLAVGKAK